MSECFIQLPRQLPQFSQAFWKASNGRAEKLGVTGSERYPVIAKPGQDVLSALQSSFSDSTFYRTMLGAGEYFPRVARPTGIFQRSPGFVPWIDDEFRYSQAKSTGQLHAFIEELQEICRNIHPEGDNLQTFGHATRNLLILACTEVELHWRKILEDNHYVGKNNTFTTKDYVKILPAMRLQEYVVTLNYYPWMPNISPFADWNKQIPTKSLSWYNAYNAVKHNREANFAEATLERTITAVTACFVMLCAQYGLNFVRFGEDAAREFFQLVIPPNWSPSELYVPANGAGYRPCDYPF